jgi:hypothetical protein
MRVFVLLGLGAALLSACGPIPVEVAEQQCLESAELAQRPRGSVGIAADSNGNVGATFSIGISADYLAGKDPDQVYASCVYGRSGQNPTRPFSSLPQSRM